ncbi:DUF1703-domain-containing protein [Terfezia boudieri ATCC MYA-4762]|uniref:DUF1703-domain-containing protein n=1 Tax=Terfezia boudieri ATCC MYA-4762 TaxID=1051890 RepID=A0A3N4LCU1_9PEZI|nr:DUF1703-domain-containing protein [Terfezia boudieri ATCC MYA-4762]
MPKILNNFLNCSIKAFYRKYAAYLGGNFTDLCQNIDNEDPIVNLAECAESVRYAIQQDERLAGIEGIYILVDEYDSFPNSYLNLPKIVGGSENAWDETAVGRTFRSFWATIKALGTEGIIKRIFITGISPLSLSGLGSAFNVARNLSFHKDLAGLCGLTSSDLEAALIGIYEDPEVYDHFLLQMTEFYNGYHFCRSKTVKTVYNTETCLAYLQCRIEGEKPATQDPENSEVSEVFLRRFATSAPAIRDFEKALECDEKGNFMPIEYSNFKLQFTVRDLSNEEDHTSWRSLIIYFGGLTFHPEKPTTHLKIPNRVAANRIALAVLHKYDLRNSLTEALQRLVNYGELDRTLGCYRELMMQRDITTDDLTQRSEANHRDSFYFCLLRNHSLVPRAEFKVIKPDQTNGRIDLVFQVPGRLIITEWKFYQIQHLNVPVGSSGNAVLAKADILRDYTLPQIIELRFGHWDKYHRGTIRSWVMENEGPAARS